MIHILLLILRIIGIVLAVIVALVLLALLYPIRYSIDLSAKTRYEADIKASWFLHLVSARAWFAKDKYGACVRVAGIKIAERTSNRDNAKNSSKKIKKIKKDKSSAKTTDQEEKGEKNKSVKESKNNGASKKSGIGINSIKKKAQDIWEKIKVIKDFMASKETKETWEKTKSYTLGIIRHIVSKKVKADITIGFKEPDKTGMVMGYVAMADAMLGIDPKNIKVVPDFEKSVFFGEMNCRGRIVVSVLGIYILRLYRIRQLRDVVKKIF